MQELRQALNRLEPKITNKAIFEVAKSTQTIEQEAKQKAPVDTGKLRQSITTRYEKNGLNGFIYANEDYAPYVEFGTGNKVKVPNGYEDLAIKFKGKGIRKINKKPKPYLIPSYFNELPNFEKNIKKVINEMGW